MREPQCRQYLPSRWFFHIYHGAFTHRTCWWTHGFSKHTWENTDLDLPPHCISREGTRLRVEPTTQETRSHVEAVALMCCVTSGTFPALSGPPLMTHRAGLRYSWVSFFEIDLPWLHTLYCIHPLLLLLPYSNLTAAMATRQGPRRVSVSRTRVVASCVR